ncbi:MAG: ribonuclease Z [Spirochaetales bacterium]|nr:ribonuclease Z [Spirochaetales bacterium]
MAFEVFILGTGGMMPLPHRALTSVLARRAGELFLFDCGEGTQVSLKKLNLRWKKITAILVSHTHADHVTGIPGMLMLTSQVDRSEPLYIIGPPKIKEYVEASMAILDMYINYEIIVKEVTKAGVVFKGDGYRINSFVLKHSKFCMGYSIEEDLRPGVFYPEKARLKNIPRGPLWSRLQAGETVRLENGKSITPDEVMGPKRPGTKISFVTDTLPVPAIAQHVAHSDLLICEGMFSRELADSALEKKHLTAEQAAKIAKQAKAKRLALIHYSPRYTERDLKILLKEAQEIFPESILAYDLQSMQINNPE